MWGHYVHAEEVVQGVASHSTCLIANMKQKVTEKSQFKARMQQQTTLSDHKVLQDFVLR